jgi:hypothetical protein
MSTFKPRIRPKGGPDAPQAECPTHDSPPDPEHDPPVFPEHDPGTEQQRAPGVVFHEDDRLR